MLRTISRIAGRVFGLLLIVSAIGGFAFGGVVDDIPELDPASATSVIALLAGAGSIARDKLRI